MSTQDHKMKTIFAAAALLSVVAAPAFAQSSDSTLLTSSVALICTIDAPADTTVTLASATQNIGNVTAQCNSASGFTSTVSSANAGFLEDSSSQNNPTRYPYTVNIPGSPALQLTSDYVLVSSPNNQDALLTAVTYPISIAVGAGTGPAYAGNYQDRLTFSLTAN